MPPAECNDFPAPQSTKNAEDDRDEKAGVAYRFQQFDSLRHVIGAHCGAFDLGRVDGVRWAAGNDFPANGVCQRLLDQAMHVDHSVRRQSAAPVPAAFQQCFGVSRRYLGWSKF